MLDANIRITGTLEMNLSGGSNNFTKNTDDMKWVENGIHISSAFSFFIGFPTNFIIIFLVLRRQNLRLPTYFFLTSLAIADILVLISMIFWITSLHSIQQSRILRHYVFSSLDIFLGVSAMLNVACVSVDRAIAVALPFKYQSLVTKKRVLSVLFACWFHSIVMLITSLLRIVIKAKFFRVVVLYIAFGSYILSISLLAISYTVILITAINKLRWEKSLLQDFPHAERRRFHRCKLTRELKITSNILLIVFPFTAGWVFIIATHIYEETSHKNIVNEVHNFILIIMPWVLSAINPVLYLLFNRLIRQSFMTSFKKLFKSQSHYFDDTKTSFLTSISRRASQTFRRASSVADENLGFLSPSKYFSKRRDSKMSGISTQSKDTENHLDVCDELDCSVEDTTSAV